MSVLYESLLFVYFFFSIQPLIKRQRYADPSGELVMGWEQQADYLDAKYGGVPLWERVPQIMWRGRILDAEHPDRDSIR